MPETKPQIHATMLETANKCGWQFVYRYGARFGIWPEEEIRPPSIAIAVGSSVHKSIAENLQYKIDFGSMIPVSQARQIAVDEFKRIKSHEGLYVTSAQSVLLNKSVGEGIDVCSDLSALHRQQLAPSLKPTAVEEKFVVQLKNYPFDLAGTIDVIESKSIRDTKTAGQKPTNDHAKTVQNAIYSYSILISKGFIPDRVTNDFLIKTKVRQLISIPDTPNNEWFQRMFSRFDALAGLITAAQKGDNYFQPASADPSSWVCTARFCGYHNRCKYWSGRK